MSDDLPAWYFEKAAHRARLEMQEYERASRAAAELAEAMKTVAELRERGKLH
jgi:hypothetical protein